MGRIFILSVFGALAGILFSAHAYAREVTLFDHTGTPVAYIDVSDQFSIYLWDGDPVAYLDEDALYGFNGKHLGWFETGLVWDHEGKVAGFIEGALDLPTKFEPFKPFKKFKPFKSFKEFAPLKPSYEAEWSTTPLEFLLGAGGK